LDSQRPIETEGRNSLSLCNIPFECKSDHYGFVSNFSLKIKQTRNFRCHSFPVLEHIPTNNLYVFQTQRSAIKFTNFRNRVSTEQYQKNRPTKKLLIQLGTGAVCCLHLHYEKILRDPTIGADGKNDVWSSAGGDDLPRLRGPCGNDPHGAVAPEHPRPGHGQATKRHRPRSSTHAVGCAQSKRLGPTQSSIYCQMHRYKTSVNPESAFLFGPKRRGSLT